MASRSWLDACRSRGRQKATGDWVLDRLRGPRRRPGRGQRALLRGRLAVRLRHVLVPLGAIRFGTRVLLLLLVSRARARLLTVSSVNAGAVELLRRRVRTPRRCGARVALGARDLLEQRVHRLVPHRTGQRRGRRPQVKLGATPCQIVGETAYTYKLNSEYSFESEKRAVWLDFKGIERRSGVYANSYDVRQN